MLLPLSGGMDETRAMSDDFPWELEHFPDEPEYPAQEGGPPFGGAITWGPNGVVREETFDADHEDPPS